MTDLQLYILVAIPLVGILANTGLFLHVSGRVDRLADSIRSEVDSIRSEVARIADSIHADMKDLNKTMTALEVDVALLKDKVGM